jgi:hypothetical protein
MKFKHDTLARVPFPPNEERLKVLQELIDKGIEPSPDELLKAAKRKNHPAHDFVFNEDVDWQNVGRREYCRRWIQITKGPDIVIGGMTYTPRAVEWTRTEDGGRWAAMGEIERDGELFDGYLRECHRMSEAMATKLGLAIELYGRMKK